MFFLVPAILLLLVLAWLTIEFSLLVPPSNGIAVLMYHKVSQQDADGLTIPASELEKQLEYIKSRGYQVLSFADLIRLQDTRTRPPRRCVILTFDDAYSDFQKNALPVLRRFGFGATVFIPVGYIGKFNAWDKQNEPIMTTEQIRTVANNEKVEFGLHSFLHHNYGEMSPEDMKEDIDNCYRTLDFDKIPYVRVLAYPYGGYPKKDKELNRQMKDIFVQKGIRFALRIGNRINAWPLEDPYEMKRIDIRGTDNYFTFKTKLRKGRRKLFS